jgi:HSP20 family protein
MRTLVPQTGNGRFARPEFALFGTLQRQIDRLFDDFTGGTRAPSGDPALRLAPDIDVTETDKEIEITAEMPGLERKDVDITLQDDTLVIKGEKKAEAQKEDKNVHLTERSYGVFYRAINLPSGIDPSTIKAAMSNGVLKITIPKPARMEPKKIEVQESA